MSEPESIGLVFHYPIRSRADTGSLTAHMHMSFCGHTGRKHPWRTGAMRDTQSQLSKK